MTDHYRESRERLARVEANRQALAWEYDRQPGPRAKVVADLHQQIGVDLKVAGVHAHLALVQVVQDRELAR